MGDTKQMIDTDYEHQMLEIEEIMQEASAYNMQREVWERAQKELEENPTIEIIEAYRLAFNELIK